MNPEKNTRRTTPLNVTREASHRIFVGLGWDPNQNLTLKDKIGSIIGQKEIYHDLDLSCYFFNKDKMCLGAVDADSSNSSNISESIYHSGDNVEGLGDGDDEQISVELKNLPPNVHYLVFKASIKSGHHLAEIEAPEMRLCDGYTGRVFYQYDIKPPEGAEYNTFIFLTLSRSLISQQQTTETPEWDFTEIHDFLHDSQISDWEVDLSRYC